jgi:signal transduction histidine kinase
MAHRAPRFWTWYALAWVPYVAIVLLAFVSNREWSPRVAIPGALINALPPAALGVAVVLLCRRIPWTPDSAGRFFAIQAALALAYGSLVVALQNALFVALESWRRGSFTFAPIVPAIVIWQLLVGMIVYFAIAAITYTIEIHSRLRAEEERSARARALQAEAELGALRAQLNPHFLFNTLHTLVQLVREDPARAERAVEQLGDLLRYALRVQGEARDEGTFAEEWKFVEDYLALEHLRLGERLRLECDVRPETFPCVVPVFCLQPLVENAVKHGIAPRAEGGTIAIAARVDDGHVELRVADDGPGARDEALRASPGMGLRLVRQRLEALYGDSGELWVEPRPPGEGFAVRVRLPVGGSR